MFLQVIDAKYVENYKIWLQFNDGESGEVDLIDKIWGDIFQPLKDKEYFKDFSVQNDTLSWENGADLAPESLYELLKQQNTNNK